MKSLSTNILSRVAVVLVVAFLAACSATTTDKKTELEKLKTQHAAIGDQIKKLEADIRKETGTAEPVNAKEVVTTTLAPKKFDHYVKTQGFVESIENIQVSAKTAGVVTVVNVVEGEMVSKGQILGRIDNSMIQRGMDEMKSSLELANTVFQRQKNLWDQKIGTEVQFLQAKNNKESLERRLASLGEQNEMTLIKSPIPGMVDEVQLRVGQNIAPGLPAVRVINNENLKLKANISEAYVSQIKTGNKAIVSFPDINKDVEAKVTFVGRNINQLSRTFVVEVKLPSTSDVRPNMSAVLKVIYGTFNNVLVVPVNVVQDVNGQKIVYVAVTDGKQTIAKKKVIEVDGVFDNLAQVKSGLATGEEVITVGYQGLNDGEVVKK